MGMFTNPISYAGYPPGVTGTPTTQNTTVRAATQAECDTGTATDCYVSPATQQASVSVDFASPPVLGFGSTTPRPVHATTISATTPVPVSSGGSGAATFTAHGVLIGAGTSAFAVTSAGLAGEVLTSGGAGADPTWTTPTFPGTVGGVGTIIRSDGTNWVATTNTFPNTAAAGDILMASGANVIGVLADVAVGQVLMSGGVGNPAYSGSPSVSGSLTAGTSITASNGNITLGTAGNKQIYTSVATNTATAGANSAGTVTLIAGGITVSTTAVDTNSLIRLTRQSVGATGANDLGILSVGTITNGTSFVIDAWTVTDATTRQADDVSRVFWEIVN